MLETAKTLSFVKQAYQNILSSKHIVTFYHQAFYPDSAICRWILFISRNIIMEDMAPIFERQSILTKEIERVNINFRKDASSRKTTEYIQNRLITLDTLWKEFEENNSKPAEFEDKQYEYFAQNIYGYMKDYYQKTRSMISSYKQQK